MKKFFFSETLLAKPFKWAMAGVVATALTVGAKAADGDKPAPAADTKDAKDTKPTKEEIAKYNKVLYYLDSAAIDFRYGEFVNAQAKLEDAVKVGVPQLAGRVQFMLGNALQSQKKWDAAVRAFELVDTYDVTALDRLNVAVALNQCYTEMKDMDKAEAALRDVALSSADKSPFTLRTGAWNQLITWWAKQKDQFAAAEKSAEAAVAKNASDEKALELLGVIYAAKEDHAKSAAIFEKLIALRAKDTESRERLATEYDKSKDYAKALAMYDELNKLNPKLGYQFAQANIEWKQAAAEKTDEAKTVKAKAVINTVQKELKPKVASLEDVENLAQFYINAGFTVDAEQLFVDVAKVQTTPADKKVQYLLTAAKLAQNSKNYRFADDLLHAVLGVTNDRDTVAYVNKSLKEIFEAQSPSLTPTPTENK